jgi:lysophospholipase L1-like esterase
VSTRTTQQRGLSGWRYLLFLTVAVLIGMEVMLRAFDPIGIVYLYDVRRYFKTMLVDDARYAYIHAPNSEGSLNGEAVRFNSIGLRGDEIDKQKPAGSTRLLILGDSVVLGWGVSEEQMFATRLRQKFKAAGLPVDIMAAGVGSWNTRTEFEFLRHVAVDYQPDVLLLLIVPNDTDPKRDGGYTEVPRDELFPPREKQDRSLLANWAEDFWRSAARVSYVAAYLKYFWLEHVADRPRKLIDKDTPQWRDAQLALDGIIDLSRERGIELIVYLDGSPQMVRTNPVLSLYDRHLKSRGIEAQLLPTEMAERRDLHISMIDSHFNNKGNRLLAETLFDYLAPKLSPATGEAGQQAPAPATATH